MLTKTGFDVIIDKLDIKLNQLSPVICQMPLKLSFFTLCVSPNVYMYFVIFDGTVMFACENC